MRLFSEKVNPTLTNSSQNILQVKDYKEIFFGVYEIEINKNKYPVEKISEQNGNPVVSVPVEVEGIKANYPFVLTKGKPEIIFNKDSDYVEIFESKIEKDEDDAPPILVEEEIEDVVLIEKKNEILEEIQKAKREALVVAEEEIKRKKELQLKQIKKDKEEKEKALSIYLESARENLVDEFVSISNKIKSELISENDGRFSEIRETIDNKIQDLAYTLDESLKKDFADSSRLIDKSIRKLVKELYDKNINPRVDQELANIALEINEKVSEIDKNLNEKVDAKADVSLVEGVNKELDAIRDANIELNNSLNKGVQKALSRVGNVDKKIERVSEQFDKKISETEKEVIGYFDAKLSLIKEETLDITDEARKYFQGVIQESRDGLLAEIRKIKNEKPIEYILESKKGEPIVKDWESIEKDWNKKIHEKFETYKTDLRKYVAVYASGGGTNATQYQGGGVIEGDLDVRGAILSGGVNILDLFEGGGSDVSELSGNWENTYTTVQANSAFWTDNFNNYLSLSGGSLSGALSISDTALAGSGSLAGSVLDLQQTWNTSGTPTAIKLDVTDTASNANSLLMDLRVGGISRARVRKDGLISARAISATGSGSNFASVTSSSSGIFSQSGGRIGISNTGYLGFASSGDATGALDVHVYRDTTDTLAQRRTSNSQEFRLYNTFTDANNFERLSLKANTGGAFEIRSEAGGSGVVRNIALMGGNVGIGTTTPNAPLAVGGNGQVISIGTSAPVTTFVNLIDRGFLGVDIGAGNTVVQGRTGRGVAFAVNNNTFGAGVAMIVNSSGNVGIGTTTPVSRLSISGGDIEAETIGNGVILKSPNGTRYRITIDNNGALISTALP